MNVGESARLKPRRLGRGLAALLEPELDIFQDVPSAPPAEGIALEKGAVLGAIQELTVSNIVPCRYQPRRHFNHEALQELAASIESKGVLNPLIVRALGHDRYELIAGERRLRAVQQLGWTRVPCRIFELSDEEVLEISLLENVQRADLNPLEEAMGYQKLLQEFSYTQERIASRVGKSRSHVANMLRILQLPGEVLTLIEEGKLTAGHARALVGLSNALELACEIVQKGLNVRQAERLVRHATVPQAALKVSLPDPSLDYQQEISDHLHQMTGMEASLKVSKKNQSGVLTLKFQHPGELDRLMEALSKGYQGT